MRAPKVCSTPGCYEDQPCPDHTAAPWEGSDRRSRLPRNWPTIVARVWKRDGNRCQRCSRPCHRGTGDGEVDHVINNDNHRLSNLQLLCKQCHTMKTEIEAHTRAG